MHYMKGHFEQYMSPVLKIIKTLILFAISFFSINCVSQPNIKFNTDVGGDADDLGALVMLDHLASSNSNFREAKPI